MSEIGIGIVGAGYMGKAHAVALQAVGSVFNTRLRPVCEMLCTSSEKTAQQKAAELGFKRATAHWPELVSDPKVEAVIIATPPESHCQIAKLALEQGKSVFCEKPLAGNLADARAMVEAAKKAKATNMVGFNYIRTPATQLAREMIAGGEIGEITYFRGEHSEDFYADPALPAKWQAQGRANGTMGELAPHMVNAALTLAGPITELSADIQTVFNERPLSSNPSQTVRVTNDDAGQFLCRFENGAMGHLMFSRVATGRKMGYIYEIFGTKGALRFNQEDQNALWFYDLSAPKGREGFRQILAGPDHPDYVNFCLGPGHGTGYQDQIIIEARDFLQAIETKKPIFPTFLDGLEVDRVIEAAFLSHENKRWVRIDEI